MEIPDKSLVWLPERGIGFYPVSANPYGQAYFEEYERRAQTPVGALITNARIDLVRRWWGDPVLDVGIGCGAFLEQLPGSRGYDINPVGIEWLRVRGLFSDPAEHAVDAMTFWDSLEHIPEIDRLLKNCRRWAFVSIPVFRDCEHVLTSRHLKKSEHYWYFTRYGFAIWAHERGFAIREQSKMEQAFGREDIESFALERVR